MDPISNLTFSEYQTLMEKGARIDPQRQFSLQCKGLSAEEWREVTPRGLPGFPKTGARSPAHAEGAATEGRLLLFPCHSLSFVHTHICDRCTTHIHAFIFETPIANWEKHIFDFMVMKQPYPMCCACNSLTVFASESTVS